MNDKSESAKVFRINPNGPSTAVINMMMQALDNYPMEAVLDAMVIMPIMIAQTFTKAKAEDITAMITENWDHIRDNCVMLNVEGTPLDDTPSKPPEPEEGNMRKLDGKLIFDLTNPLLEHYGPFPGPTSARDLTIRLTGIPPIIFSKIGVSKKEALEMLELNWDMFVAYAKTLKRVE